MVGLVAALLLAAGPDLRADLLLRSEVRASQLAPDQVTRVERTSLDVTPIGAVAVESREFRLRLSYAPRIWVPDLRLRRVDVDHQVDVRGEGLLSPAWNLAIAGTASRGLIDPLTDMWTSIAPPGASHTTITYSDPLQYQSVRGAVESLYRLSAAGGIAASAYAGWSSGDSGHRTILPPQRSLGGSLGYQQALDARSELRVLANANVIRTFANGPDSESGYVTGDASLRRRLSAYLTGIVGVGGSYIRQTSQFLDPVNGWAPVFTVGLDLASDRPGPTLRSAVSYLPQVDRITGRARRVVEGATVFDWPVSLDLSFGAGLRASALVPGVDPATLSLEARVSRRLGDKMVVRAGARTRRQTTTVQQVDPRPGSPLVRTQPNYLESTAFVAFDWDAIRTTRGQAPVGAK